MKLTMKTKQYMGIKGNEIMQYETYMRDLEDFITNASENIENMLKDCGAFFDFKTNVEKGKVDMPIDGPEFENVLASNKMLVDFLNQLVKVYDPVTRLKNTYT